MNKPLNLSIGYLFAFCFSDLYHYKEGRIKMAHT